MNQITTHILDTSKGKPVAEVDVILQRQDGAEWIEIGRGCTDHDGRVSNLVTSTEPLPAGSHKLIFHTQPYFQRQQLETFYPYIEIVFQIEDDGQHYHVPLLLNPYGYSTYRGS